MVNVTFWGVRGSTPCSCDDNRRYGGNTSCVTLEAPGLDPIVFDLGTGLRFYGESLQGAADLFRGLALVTHLHWDHVQGLPFFGPIHQPGSSLVVHGRSEGGTVDAAFREFMRPPFFPVGPDDLPGDLSFHDLVDAELSWGRARITAADVPHTGPTNGYRVEIDGIVVVYVSDHQQPADPGEISPAVLELCRDADLVIHDAQFEAHELAVKADWGHCTVDYAVRVAAAAGARRLVLFHHDPSHSDDTVDRLLAEARMAATGTAVQEVIAAAEGLTVSLSSALV
jgi:phosphoribosyl 1,2-cyclic phosphodiesterase